MKIEQFFLEGLGHQSYLVAEEGSGVAAIVDPRRDIDVYLEAAGRRGVQITHILETHVHNDYVSGGRELAAKVGAKIIASGIDPLVYADRSVRDGDRIVLGRASFEVLGTPGHTPEHVSYLLFSVGMFGTTTAVTYALSGLVNWLVALKYIGGGVLGGLIGARLATHLGKQKKTLARIFAEVIIVVAIYMLYINLTAIACSTWVERSSMNPVSEEGRIKSAGNKEESHVQTHYGPVGRVVSRRISASCCRTPGTSLRKPTHLTESCYAGH